MNGEGGSYERVPPSPSKVFPSHYPNRYGDQVGGVDDEQENALPAAELFPNDGRNRSHEGHRNGNREIQINRP